MFWRRILARYDPQRARLRTFLRVCVDHFVANADKAAQRLKRGGEAQVLALDFQSAEGELQLIEIPAPDSMEDFFERGWVRSVFSLSLERLRQECDERGKQVHFHLLEFYDIDEAGKELTYEQVGVRFDLKASDVTNYLAYARREFRRIVLEQLREMTGSEEDSGGKREPSRSGHAMKWLSDQALDRLRVAADMPDLSGTGYVLLGKLGAGGMGGVFRVEDTALGRQVALKVIGIVDSSGELSARLLREAKIIAQLEHPGIVPVHDVGPCPTAACSTP